MFATTGARRIDIEALHAFARDEATLRALADLLRAMRADADVRAASATSRLLPEGLRGPMVRYALRALGTQAALRALLFVEGEALDAADAERACGAGLRDALLAASILVIDPVTDRASVRATLRLARDEDDLVLGEEPRGEPRGTPRQAARVPLPDAQVSVRSAVHLGAGDGRGALRLARAADAVLAVDRRPRERALASVNVALSATKGDGARVTVADDASRAREVERLVVDLEDPFGDEVAGATVRDLATALRGLAIDATLALRLATFSTRTIDEVRALLEEAARGPAQLCTFALPPESADEACAREAARRVPELGPRYEERFLALRGAARGEQRNELIAVLRRRPGLIAARAHVEWPTPSRELEGPRLLETLAALELAESPDARLLDARVRFPERAVVIPREAPASPELHAPPRAPTPIPPPLLAAFQQVHAAPHVLGACEALARRSGATAAAVAAQLLPAVRDALRSGLLVAVAPGGAP